ncbi:DUF4861 family protein [Flavobacterium faecale]|uniref:DUF4861 family protein n=1 Tax=Flavobacterium faecale TaxID=1355330 RepID=UPI00131F4149|nr:DUF4861 family protein [Flavobacterium faecale]
MEKKNQKSATIIKVKNPIATLRDNETISIPYKLLQKEFPSAIIAFIQLIDNKSHKTIVSQPIDNNEDGITDAFLFQTDLEPNETKYFSVNLSQNIPDSSSVFAKFISKPEGLGDFCWENDYIGYRMYGQARADAQGTGTAIDVWCKKTDRKLTDDWYTAGQSYHIDKGYGADHYASGKNQGCGGSGILHKDSIYYSKPYSSWKIIANGPVRLVFELKFSGWKIDNTYLRETKRITLDAGQYLNRIESTYEVTDKNFSFSHAIGIAQRSDSKVIIDKKNNLSESWEKLTIPAGSENGSLGCAFIADPKTNVKNITSRNNHLFGIMTAKSEKSIIYYTGAAWSEFGNIQSFENWNTYIQNKKECINHQCTVTILK